MTEGPDRDGSQEAGPVVLQRVGMAKKFMQTVLVADALSELQRADLTTSLREIYYRTKHTIQIRTKTPSTPRTSRTP